MTTYNGVSEEVAENNPVSPIIYEFNKIGNDTIEVTFYESYYWNADYGFWRGSGVYRKDVYVQDAALGKLYSRRLGQSKNGRARF